ncbi:NmrA family NAD(P)-binding protein [Aeromicrobium sp. CF3.5]|uniref:NmrA family NAD(P)-binding protein n=1 Tax=Aeromicrobium sp. CF3.5 TaxID=3373078 RepID=UPI003EE67D2F
MPTLAITGATGVVGSTAARHLAAAGRTARLIVRDAARTVDLPGFDIATFPGTHGPALRAALSGIDTAFMVSAYEDDNRLLLHQDFVDAAVRCGVRQIVYLSFVGAADDAVCVYARDHGATETYLNDSGLDVTILRSNLYAETLVDLVHEDQIRAPAADGRIAAVARADVGAAVGAVLADPKTHVGQTYELSGPDALSLDDVATLLEPVIGVPIAYTPQSDEQARQQKRDHCAPDEVLDAWLSAYVAIRHGIHGHVTDDVRHLTGRAPTPAAQALAHWQE